MDNSFRMQLDIELSKIGKYGLYDEEVEQIEQHMNSCGPIEMHKNDVIPFYLKLIGELRSQECEDVAPPKAGPALTDEIRRDINLSLTGLKRHEMTQWELEAMELRMQEYRNRNYSENELKHYGLAEMIGLRNVQEILHGLFSYHAPKAGQPQIYEEIRSKGHELALMITKYAPIGGDRDEAIKAVRAAVMWANAAIANGD